MSIKKTYILQLLPLLVIIFSASEILAQEKPPIPVKVEVNTARWLNFGSFTTGTNGGTVVVDFSGKRTATSDVTLLNMGATHTSAMFDVRAIPGTIIHIKAPVDVPLKGTNGGTIYLDIDSFSTGQTFIHTGNANTPTAVEVGGTLRVSNSGSNPPGSYNGSFTLTFINQ